MEGKIEAAVISFSVVMCCIAFYTLAVRPHLPTNVQGWFRI
jgi:hypothetical protein